MPNSGRSGVCVPIGGMLSPFQSRDSPPSYQAVDVPVLGAQDTSNRVRSSSGTPHFFSWGHHICSESDSFRPSVHCPLLLHRDGSPGPINLVPVQIILMSLLAVV